MPDRLGNLHILNLDFSDKMVMQVAGCRLSGVRVSVYLMFLYYIFFFLLLFFVFWFDADRPEHFARFVLKVNDLNDTDISQSCNFQAQLRFA